MVDVHLQHDLQRVMLTEFWRTPLSSEHFIIQENMIRACDGIMFSPYFKTGNYHHFGIKSRENCLTTVPRTSTILMCRFRDGELQRVIEQCRALPQHKYILVQTLIGDDGFVTAEDLSTLPPNIVRIYSKNVSVHHEKLIPIPIGRDWRVTEEHFVKSFMRHYEQDSENLAYMNFSLETNSIRSEVYRRFSSCSWVTSHKPRAYREYNFSHTAYAEQMSKHLFTFSPIGKAVDCYRTWEALFVKSIPLVDRTPHASVYADLPVILIDDWDIVTEEWLRMKLDALHSQRFNLSKLTAKYWRELIHKDAEANF